MVGCLLVACGRRQPDVAPPRGELMCTLEARSGLQIRVSDRVSAENVLPTALVKALDGSYVDSVRVPTSYTRPDFIPLVRERPGTYTVVIERAGYARFEQRGVRVTSNGCHVTPVIIEALLEKLR